MLLNNLKGKKENVIIEFDQSCNPVDRRNAGQALRKNGFSTGLFFIIFAFRRPTTRVDRKSMSLTFVRIFGVLSRDIFLDDVSILRSFFANSGNQ